MQELKIFEEKGVITSYSIHYTKLYDIGGSSIMRQLTHGECISLLDDIGRSPTGDWTHELTEISSGPARITERAVLPTGLEVVYFRAEDGAKAWPAVNWDRFALQISKELETPEQLTLF